MAITNEHVLDAISGVIDPNLNTDYVSADAVKDISIQGVDV